MLDNRTSLDMKLCVLHYLASVNLFMGGHPDNEWQRDDRGFPAGMVFRESHHIPKSHVRNGSGNRPT